MRALWEISISLDPIVAIHMCTKTTYKLIHRVIDDADLCFQVHIVYLAAIPDERPIEKVTIKGCENKWFGFTDVSEKSVQERFFIWLIKDSKHSNIIFRFRAVLKVLDICTHDRAVCDQETFTV